MLGHHCGVLVFCYTEINFQRMWGKAVIRLIQDVIQNLVGQANEITPIYQFDWETYILATKKYERHLEVCLLVEDSNCFSDSKRMCQ